MIYKDYANLYKSMFATKQHATAKIKVEKLKESIPEGPGRKDKYPVQEEKAKSRKVQRMRICFKRSPKRASFQNENNGQDQEETGKALWRRSVQQVYETADC